MKTIIEMALEAGIDDWWNSGSEWRETFDAHIERFAELVRADEREACAKVCDDMAFDWQKYVTTPSGTITACAAAIRARGNT